MKRVFGFVGGGGTGKDTAANYLVERYGAAHFSFSILLQNIMAILHLEPSRDHLIRISEAVRREFGEDALARAISEEVKSASADLVVVSSIRRVADIHYLRELPHFVLVHITASPETRLARIRARAQKPDDAGKTMEQFLADEQRSTERSIADVAAQAQVTINNDGTREVLRAQLDALVK